MTSHDIPWPRMVVGNVGVDLVGHADAMSVITESFHGPEPLAVVSANLHHIHHFVDDEAWQERTPVVSDGGLRWLTLIDGDPLVRAARRLTGRGWPRLAGSDIVGPILDAADGRGVRLGIFGGSHETHQAVTARLARSHPGLCIVGAWAPERSVLTDRDASTELAAEVRRAEVEVLLVSLSKPMQERWIAEFGAATGANVLLAFGAATDFVSQKISRAPEWVAGAGVEWAWRLMLEPRRLGRRYLIEGPPALYRLVRTARLVPPALPGSSTAGPAGAFAGVDDHAVVTAVVVTYNSGADIALLIEDLRHAAGRLPLRLVVVDNESADDTVDVVRRYPDVVLVETGGNVGYARAVNAALPLAGDESHVLILNPDLRLSPDAVDRLVAVFEDSPDDRVGAVVPLMLDERGVVYPSLRREPSITRAIGDGLFGARLRRRSKSLSEIDFRPGNYSFVHEVDWATGAALLIRAGVVAEVGRWNESFFLYSEEVDYFRRIRESGRSVVFDPTAVVFHRGGGSGRSVDLLILNSVNKVRYVEQHHSTAYAALFRVVIAAAHALRGYAPAHRKAFAVLVNRRRWRDLPRAAEVATAEEPITGPKNRGAVIVPAYNEAAVIRQTLAPLSRLAVDGYVELIVVCNGCSDDTADVARGVPGVRVLELQQGSKPKALNAGDAAASSWPRLYLDADVTIPAASVLAVLDRLGSGDVLTAAPNRTFDMRNSSAVVRSYYRAGHRVRRHKISVCSVGAYGLSKRGHARFDTFPAVIADDYFVDTRFDDDEKLIVPCDPLVVRAPATTKTLVAILSRHQRGAAEIAQLDREPGGHARGTGANTFASLMSSVRGLRSAVDTAVFIAIALAARRGARRAVRWERDETTRTTA